MESIQKYMPFCIILLWIVLTAWLVLEYEIPQKGSTVVELPAIPVDPRDPLRGDFIRLRYPISRVPCGTSVSKNILCTSSSIKKSTIVYMRITKANNTIVPQELSYTVPQLGSLFLRGRITAIANKTIYISYGIERYYVAEGKGKALERKASLLATIAIDAQGKSVLQNVE